MSTGKHPAELLADALESDSPEFDHCADAAAMLRTIPALEARRDWLAEIERHRLHIADTADGQRWRVGTMVGSKLVFHEAPHLADAVRQAVEAREANGHDQPAR